MNAIEPSAAIGMVDRNLMAMVISEDGRSIIDRATVVANRVMATSDLRCAGDVCVLPGPQAPALFAPVAAQSLPVSPTARRDFTAFFSRVAGGVYLLGGHDASTGTTLHDVWFQAVDGAWTERPVVGATLGDVVAATYSFHDARLWVLDRGEDRRLRLVRIDVRTGKASVSSGLRAEDDGASVFLTIDRDGAVLLTRATEEEFTVSRLEINNENELSVTGLHEERGRLLLPPVVSDLSYAFVIAGEHARDHEDADGSGETTRADATPPVQILRHANIFATEHGRPPHGDRGDREAPSPRDDEDEHSQKEERRNF